MQRSEDKRKKHIWSVLFQTKSFNSQHPGSWETNEKKSSRFSVRTALEAQSPEIVWIGDGILCHIASAKMVKR